MFERYSPEARRCVFFARYFASRFSSTLVEPRHILLGLARENFALVKRFLNSEVSEDSLRDQILANEEMRTDSRTHLEDIAFADESNAVFVFAAEEADRMGSQSIGAEHLLLGLLRERADPAAQILLKSGAKIERVRTELAISPHRPPPKDQRILREIEAIQKTLGGTSPGAGGPGDWPTSDQ